MEHRNDTMARVYELLEQFDFKDLNADDRNYVLSVMDEPEYNQMRLTIGDVAGYFEQTQDVGPGKLELDKSGEKNKLIQWVRKPVPLYQVAASILILLGLFFTYNNYQNPTQSPVLTSNEAIQVHKADTVYTRITDTVRVVVEKLVYITPVKEDNAETPMMASVEHTELSSAKQDCKHNLCPDDMEAIGTMNTSNSASGDSILKSFVVSLN